MAEKTQITFTFPSLPEALEGFRLVHLSDLHMGRRTQSHILKKLIDEVSVFQPDLICFTGDFLTHSKLKKGGELLSFLNELKAPLCIASLGNHDYIDQEPHGELVSLLKKSPFKLLHNESFRSDHFQIVGLGDLEPGKCLPKKAFSVAEEDLFTIALTHNPDTIPLFEEFRSDLILAGHTHGGQINLPIVWNLFTRLKHKQFKRGLIASETSQVYVSRGVGTHTLFRILSPPEIVLATLRRS